MKSHSRHAAESPSTASTEHPQARRHGAPATSTGTPARSHSRRRDEEASRAGLLQAPGDGGTVVDDEQRREMIATAAYLRAERRGFENGSDLEDWLAAEEEIDQWLRQVDIEEEEPPLFEE